MKKFQFPYPIKPWIQNQAWGVYNPAYQRFGFTRHNGIDIAPGADKLIRAPFPGTIVRAATRENNQWQPNGGGIFASLLSDETYIFNDGKVVAHVLADFLHCERLFVSTSQHVIQAQALSIAGNTGFSTGAHTHIQLRRCKVLSGGDYIVSGKPVHLDFIDQNDANGSFDPAPYYTLTYVLDDALSGIQLLVNRIAAAIAVLRSRKGRP